jgi:thiopeptide-type bacteriocin biosynthesis protein
MTIRKFNPGTEWVFLKIYTGIKTSDLVLEDIIIPLVKNFNENNLINKWFFIRYHDPKSHLRVRIHLTDIDHYGFIIKSINDKIKILTNSGEIYKIVIDTYKPEIERYGEKTIEFAEELFHKSSELILNFLDFDDEEKIMVTMFYIDQILTQIKLSNRKKLDWIGHSNDFFKKEFNSNKNLNRQLSKKYVNFKPNYYNFINLNGYEELKNKMILNIEQSRTSLSGIISEQKEIKLAVFLQSIFHMHINRIFISNQRLFEMIVYDYLVRHYKSMNY